jgi:predicted dienelactone hydrolase
MNPNLVRGVLSLPALVLAIFCGFVSPLCAGESAAVASVATPAVVGATREVKTLLVTWRDVARGRDVPVKIYYPVAGVGASDPACPVIVFSHGLGGSREGYAYLGEHWAAHGYVSVHVQHVGSDDAVWRTEKRKLAALRALRGAAKDPEVINARPLDVRFVIDRLTTLASDETFVLHGRLDLARLGVAGHSFGAFTTLAVAGKAYPKGGGAGTARWADPRVKAVIAMSTPAPSRPGKPPSGAGYEAVRIPVFHLTGTEDTDAAGGADDASFRRIPYDYTSAAPAWLLTLEGGDHMVFGGPMQGDGRGERMKAKRKDRDRDPEFHALIQKATTAFWDAQLRGDAEASVWLDEGGLAKEATGLAKLEHKTPATP